MGILGHQPSQHQPSQHQPLKGINPEYSWGGLMLKLKCQYFGYLIQKSSLTGKYPDAGRD